MGIVGRISGLKRWIEPMMTKVSANDADRLQNVKRDSSLEQLLLAVTSSQNDAKQLYLDFGFENFGREPNALRVVRNDVGNVDAPILVC